MTKRASPNCTTLDDRPLAFSYLRFSTPEQALGDSARRQIEAVRAYASTHNLKLDESLRDEGISAFKGKNRDATAALGSFLEQVKSGRVPKGSYLIVESLDRLSRETALVAFNHFSSIIQSGITLVTLSDNQEYSFDSMVREPMALFWAIMVMMRSHEESVIKSQRVGKAWGRKREEARATLQAMSARAPAWIRLVGGPKTGRYELIEERADVVREIFELTIQGLGRRAIQKEFNKRPVPTWGPSKNGEAFWQTSYIGKILTNPATYGSFKHHPKTVANGADPDPIPNYFPAAISEETFWAARAAAKRRGHGKGTPGGRRNLMTGLVKCPSCGDNMIYLQKERARLQCGRAHANGGCGHRSMYDYDWLELQVLFVLQFSEPNFGSAQNGHAGLVQELSAAQARHDDLETQIENLIDVAANLDSKAGAKSLAARIAEIETKRDAAKTEIVRLSDTLREQSASEIETSEAAGAVVALYRGLRAYQGDALTKARADISQKLKFLISKITLGPSGYTIEHANGKKTTSENLSGSW